MEQQDELAAAALAMTEEVQELTPLTVDQLDKKIIELRDLDDKYKELKLELTQLGDLVDAKKHELLNILDALDRPNYTLPGVGMASKVTRKGFKMPEDTTKREAIFQYIATNYGKEALYGYTTIHSAKFNSFVNEEVANGKVVPGVDAPTISTTVNFLRR